MNSEIRKLRSEMMQWVNGERSHWNTFNGMDGDQSTIRGMCALADAQEVIKLSAAIQALVAMSRAN